MELLAMSKHSEDYEFLPDAHVVRLEMNKAHGATSTRNGRAECPIKHKIMLRHRFDSRSIPNIVSGKPITESAAKTTNGSPSNRRESDADSAKLIRNVRAVNVQITPATNGNARTKS
jgi:hypothetical protein